MKSLTQAQVNGMSMGRLAVDFGRLQHQNHSDSIVGATLTILNKDRIRIAHKRGKASAERALRTNVGQQMWRIVAALKELDQS